MKMRVIKKKSLARRVITTIRPAVVNGRYINNSFSFHYSKALLSHTQTPNNKILKALKAVKKNNHALAQALQVMRLELRNKENSILNLQRENIDLKTKFTNQAIKSKQKLDMVRNGLHKNSQMLLNQIQVINETLECCEEEEKTDCSNDNSFADSLSLSINTPFKDQDPGEEKDESDVIQPYNNNNSQSMELDCSIEEQVQSNNCSPNNLNDDDYLSIQHNKENTSNYEQFEDSLSEKGKERTLFDMTVIEEEDQNTTVRETIEEFESRINFEQNQHDVSSQPYTEPSKQKIITTRRKKNRSSKKSRSCDTKINETGDNYIDSATLNCDFENKTVILTNKIKTEIINSPFSSYACLNNSWTPQDEDISKYMLEYEKENITENNGYTPVLPETEMPSPILKTKPKTEMLSPILKMESITPPRRPSRRAKSELSYKEPSLMKKMRR